MERSKCYSLHSVRFSYAYATKGLLSGAHNRIRRYSPERNNREGPAIRKRRCRRYGISQRKKSKNTSDNNLFILATISVLPCQHVTTVQSFGAMSKDINGESASREASFVLLQLVNALKSLQARGIEDASRSLSDVVLCREDVYYRLYLLQGLVFPRETTVNLARYNNANRADGSVIQRYLTSVLQKVKHRPERRAWRGASLPVRVRFNSTATVTSDGRAAAHTRFADT